MQNNNANYHFNLLLVHAVIMLIGYALMHVPLCLWIGIAVFVTMFVLLIARTLKNSILSPIPGIMCAIYGGILLLIQHQTHWFDLSFFGDSFGQYLWFALIDAGTLGVGIFALAIATKPALEKLHIPNYVVGYIIIFALFGAGAIWIPHQGLGGGFTGFLHTACVVMLYLTGASLVLLLASNSLTYWQNKKGQLHND